MKPQVERCAINHSAYFTKPKRSNNFDFEYVLDLSNRCHRWRSTAAARAGRVLPKSHFKVNKDKRATLLDCALPCSAEQWTLSGQTLQRKARTVKISSISSPSQALFACREIAHMKFLAAAAGQKGSLVPTVHASVLSPAAPGERQSCLCLRDPPQSLASPAYLSA